MKHSDLATAIAHAEGFGVPGSIPTRAHNPGDLVMPHWTGPKLGAEGITVFADDTTGWAALEHQLDLIRSSKSHVYLPSMTIAQLAAKWTRTEQPAWTANLCDKLRELGRPATAQMLLKDVL